MESYEKSLKVLDELFQKDCIFAFATCKDTQPSLRILDTYYEDGAFYIVTYALSNKVKELMDNPNCALCYQNYKFQGTAQNIGHPLEEKNKEIREKLIKVFEPWYFAHNNEQDKNMCYVKFVPKNGFFYKDGTGYIVDFTKKEASTIPFEFDNILP